MVIRKYWVIVPPLISARPSSRPRQLDRMTAERIADAPRARSCGGFSSVSTSWLRMVMPTGAIKTPNANGTRQPQAFKLDWESAKRQHEANQAAQQAAQVLACELPTRKEHAPIFRRGLEQKHGRRTHLAADREALKEARDDQEDRRQDANRRVARRDRDDRAADGHEPDGERHRRFAPGAVAISADQRAAKRPRDEADAEGGGRRQIAHQDIVRRKERLANHPQECGVDREVEEFEAVAEDRREDTAGFERWPSKSGCGIRSCGQASLLASRRSSVSGPRVACQTDRRRRPITSQEQRVSGGQKP